MKYAVIYARFSSEKQNDQSIEGQLRICNKYAEDNDLTIVDTYIDRAMTGTNDQRAALQQMLSDSEKPVVWDIVLVYAIDRFGRDSIEIAVNKQKLRKNKKTLISATQRTSVNIDGSKNLDGILLENIYIGIAEYYSAELSQKVKRGIYENYQKGFYHGGTLSFGFKAVDKKIYIDEEKAKIVLYIFQQYAAGRGGEEILNELTNNRVYHRGKPIRKSTFYDMLHREEYTGITHCKNGTYNNLYPAIVPKPLFDEVQRRLAINKLGGNSIKTDFLLKRKCICGVCGKSIQGESGTSGNGNIKYYYKCSGRKQRAGCNSRIFRKDDLENIVTDVTFKLFNNPENLEIITNAVLIANKNRLHNQSIKKILIDEREQLQKNLDNLVKAIEAGILTPTTKSRMEELEEKILAINDKIAIEEYKEKNSLKKEQVIEYLSHQIKLKPKLMLYALIQKIILFDDKIEIYYNYIKNPYPDDFSPEIARDSSFIPCSIQFQSVAPFKKIRFDTIYQAFFICFYRGSSLTV